MNPQEMLEDLKGQLNTLYDDLKQLQVQYQLKREQYLKIEGAIEALSSIQSSEDNA